MVCRIVNYVLENACQFTLIFSCVSCYIQAPVWGLWCPFSWSCFCQPADAALVARVIERTSYAVTMFDLEL